MNRRWIIAAAVLATACGAKKEEQAAATADAASPMAASSAMSEAQSEMTATAASPSSPVTSGLSPVASKKGNAATEQLRDSVIKPTHIIDEKTGKVTPVKKP
jgi:type IV secretory pathway TrbL component